MNKSKKVKDIKYKRKVDGVLRPNALCGKVSAFSDKDGFRCCAHGNFKCANKVELK